MLYELVNRFPQILYSFHAVNRPIRQTLGLYTSISSTLRTSWVRHTFPVAEHGDELQDCLVFPYQGTSVRSSDVVMVRTEADHSYTAQPLLQLLDH